FARDFSRPSCTESRDCFTMLPRGTLRQQACKVAIVAQGFTKYALPAPERLCKPLSARTCYELLLPERPPRKPRRVSDRHVCKYGKGITQRQGAVDSRPRARVVRSWAMPD